MRTEKTDKKILDLLGFGRTECRLYLVEELVANDRAQPDFQDIMYNVVTGKIMIYTSGSGWQPVGGTGPMVMAEIRNLIEGKFEEILPAKVNLEVDQEIVLQKVAAFEQVLQDFKPEVTPGPGGDSFKVKFDSAWWDVQREDLLKYYMQKQGIAFVDTRPSYLVDNKVMVWNAQDNKFEEK